MADPKHSMAGAWYLVGPKMRENLAEVSPGPKLDGVKI